MKKVLVTLDFPPESGGIQRYLHEIVWHTFQNCDVVLAAGDRHKTSSADALYPCTVIRAAGPFACVNKKMVLISMLAGLVRIVLKEGKNLSVAGGNVYAAIVPFLIYCIVPLRYQVYCYGSELLLFTQRSSMKSLFLKMVLRHADTVYYLTATTKKMLQRTIGSGNYVQCVPKIDLPENYAPRAEPDFCIMPLLSVGRLVPHKGHSVLVEAVHRIGNGIDWNLTIVGNGPEHGRLAAMIHGYALEKKVTIKTGASDDECASIYAKSGIFILPSIETGSAVEGFGIVLLEAMLHGVAIIASRSGGIPDVFEGAGECCVLVPPANPDALCSAIIALSHDHSRRQAMVRNARQLLEKRYAWK